MNDTTPTLPDGKYEWKEENGGTCGPHTCTALVSEGRVTEWRTVSADGKKTTTANEYQLTLGGDHFLVTLANRIEQYTTTNRMTFTPAKAEAPAALLPVQVGRRGWGWIPVRGGVA